MSKVKIISDEDIEVLQEFFDDKDYASAWIYLTAIFSDLDNAENIPYMFEGTIGITKAMLDQNFILPSIRKPVETYLDEIYSKLYRLESNKPDDSAYLVMSGSDDETLN